MQTISYYDNLNRITEEGQTMHEFLRDNLALKYEECKSCEKRSQFACVRCGFCWSCHWKQEPYAENLPRYLLKPGI